MLKQITASAMILVSYQTLACEVASGVAEVTPISSFMTESSGLSVVNLNNGLVWQKCAIGQIYNSEKVMCEGSPTHYSDWYTALNALDAINAAQYDGYSTWRIPSYKELYSLVETGCTAPTINSLAFPNTPAANFYTSTPTRSTDIDGNALTPGQGLLVKFYSVGTSTMNHLRLVRDF